MASSPGGNFRLGEIFLGLNRGYDLGTYILLIKHINSCSYDVHRVILWCVSASVTTTLSTQRRTVTCTNLQKPWYTFVLWLQSTLMDSSKLLIVDG